jgi:branched-chain amino acid transport system ATP-binding protein
MLTLIARNPGVSQTELPRASGRFDEPSLGLAPTIVQSMLKIVRNLNRDGLTCVLVEQNVAVSLKLANHAFVLENGRITLAGTGAALLSDDRVRQAYLGL